MDELISLLAVCASSRVVDTALENRVRRASSASIPPLKKWRDVSELQKRLFDLNEESELT